VEQVTIECAQINLQTLIFVMELTFRTKHINSGYSILIVWCSADVVE